MDAAEAIDHDRRLVQRALDGDDDAFEQLFDSCFPPLFRFALRRTGGDESVAEDVVQRTLCIAVTKLRAWRAEAALLTWLCSICRNELASHYRRHPAARQPLELDEGVPEVRRGLERLRGACDDPERHALRGQLRALVHDALDRIPQHYARVLELKYLEEVSMKEIAWRLDTSPKAVESLLTRARSAYREALDCLLGGAAKAKLIGGGDGRG